MKKLLCGFAQADITPKPETVYQDGYGHRFEPATGVKAPLYAKVCMMQSGESRFAVIVMDICSLGDRVKENLRGWVRAATGLKNEEFALCATHTHSGPASEALHNLPVNWLYWNFVGDRVAEAVRAALASMCECRCRFAYGNELTQAMNRRERGVIDRRVPVCAFYDTQERLRGVIASASCHAVCNTDFEITSDYPSVLTREAAERFPGVPFLFLAGRGADVDPHSDHYEGMLPPEILGREFADSVYAALDRMTGAALEPEGIHSIFRTVTVPMSYPSREELESALADFSRQILEASPDTSLYDRRSWHVEVEWHNHALREIDRGREPAVEADFQAVLIGREWVFAFVPFELLTLTGNAIEQIFAGYGISSEKCFVIGYSNGTFGYLAPAAECGTDTYETRLAAHWYGLPICRKETEQTVLKTFAELAEELLGDHA